MSAPMAAICNSSSQTPHNVFVYGSLLADEVVRVLLKRLPPSSPAILHGHQRFSIQGRVYPAIVPMESEKVAGKVIMGITDYELDILDAFEDVEYEKSAVEISLVDTLEKLHAYTYVWVEKDDPNLQGHWDFDEWRRLHMKDFVEMSVGFMEESQQPESKTRVATYHSYFQQD